MRTRLIPLAELTDGDVVAWRELAARALEPNPFVEPDVVLPAAAHLGATGVALMVVADEEGWTVCLPVEAARWHGLRMPAIASWRHPYTFLGTPLVAPDTPVATLGRLLDEGPGRARAAILGLLSLGADGSVAEALGVALGERGRSAETYREHERATLDRRQDGDYHAGMRAHHRRELRRLRRRLEHETDAELSTRDLAGDGAAVERFLELEQAGWKGGAGTALGSSAPDAHFFRELCRRFADAGRLELLALEAGERTVAMKCNLRAGDAVFCFKIAFDEELAKFSPGVQLELDNVERFHQGTATWMDSCANPDHPMINRLWPDRRRIATILLPGPGALGHVSRRGARMAQAWRTRERSPSWARS